MSNSLSVREAAEITNLVEERLKAAFTEDAYVLIEIEPSPGKNQNFKNKRRSSEERRRKKITSFDKIKYRKNKIIIWQ